jgi:RHS repeat-associated protein
VQSLVVVADYLCELAKNSTASEKGSDEKGDGRYYPFGLTMAGISDKALKGNYAENKYRFNGGNELQNKEFSDGSGLELYANEYRPYDPQIARFNQPDVLGELSFDFSPYSFASCNPILRSDPLGLKDTVVNGEHGSTSATFQEVVVTAKKASKSVGQPGLLESAIPVWGSGRAAADDFQNGRWGWGLFNTALAITDVFLVKSIVTGVGKIVAKSIYKSVAEEVIKVNTERITLATLRNLTRESLLNSVDNPALKKVIENL